MYSGSVFSRRSEGWNFQGLHTLFVRTIRGRVSGGRQRSRAHCFVDIKQTDMAYRTECHGRERGDCEHRSVSNPTQRWISWAVQAAPASRFGIMPSQSLLVPCGLRIPKTTIQKGRHPSFGLRVERLLFRNIAAIEEKQLGMFDPYDILAFI